MRVFQTVAWIIGEYRMRTTIRHARSGYLGWCTWATGLLYLLSAATGTLFQYTLNFLGALLLAFILERRRKMPGFGQTSLLVLIALPGLASMVLYGVRVSAMLIPQASVFIQASLGVTLSAGWLAPVCLALILTDILAPRIAEEEHT